MGSFLGTDSQHYRLYKPRRLPSTLSFAVSAVSCIPSLTYSPISSWPTSSTRNTSSPPARISTSTHLPHHRCSKQQPSSSSWVRSSKRSALTASSEIDHHFGRKQDDPRHEGRTRND